MNHLFAGWEPWHGADPDPPDRRAGGRPAGHGDGLRHLQPAGARRDLHRARRPTSTRAWSSARTRAPSDLDVNITKEKKLTNMRASTADEAIRLIPPRLLGLEQASSGSTTTNSWRSTPKSLRLRKRVLQFNQRPRRDA